MHAYVKHDFVFLKLDVRRLLVLLRNITLNTIYPHISVKYF